MTYFTTNQQYPLGIDLSVYNCSADGYRKPNFDLIAAHQPAVEFIAMRAGNPGAIVTRLSHIIWLKRNASAPAFCLIMWSSRANPPAGRWIASLAF